MHIDNSPEVLDLSVRIHTDNNTNPGSMANSRPDKGPELGNLGDKQYHRILYSNEMLDG